MVALVLHGWPQSEIGEYFLTKHLRERGYKTLTPDMFTSDYRFSPGNILAAVRKGLRGEKIDLVVGISLGGLIAPHIAKEYPNAKLIFISSGCRLRSKSPVFNLFVIWAKKLVRFSLGKALLLHLQNLPDLVLALFYKLANPFTGDRSRMGKYESDMDLNISFMKKIPLEKEEEILDFVANADNSGLLKTLKNKTLIFSGENDLLMDVSCGKELSSLIQNSKLDVSGGSHFDSFTKASLEKIDKFLEQ